MRAGIPAAVAVILLFDIWPPELSANERVLVTRLLQPIDSFGPRREWVD